MIRRKMFKAKSQSKGGKRDLVKKVTIGLLMTSLASGVILNGQVIEANAAVRIPGTSENVMPIHSRPRFLPDADADKIREEQALIADNLNNAEAKLKERLDGYYKYDSNLKYSKYRKVLNFDLVEKKGLDDAVTTIAKLLNYHGSKEFDLSVIETNQYEKTIKVVVGFNPDLTQKDENGYAVKLNLGEYTEDEMRDLEQRYTYALENRGYNVVEYKDSYKRVDNLRFIRNFDNGRKQFEFEHIMKVINKYIAENAGAENNNFALKVWQDPGTKHVCVRIHVDVDSKVEALETFVSKDVVNQDVKASQPVVEEVSTEETINGEVIDGNGQATETTVDQEGFMRTNIAEAIVVEVNGETKEEQDMNDYGNTVNAKILEYLNQERLARNLSPLVLDNNATQVVNEKCLDMLNTNQVRLQDSNGVSPAQYLRDAGVVTSASYDMVGICDKMWNPEDSARSIVSKIMENEKLSSKVLDPIFTHIGIGVGFNGDTIYACEILTAY